MLTNIITTYNRCSILDTHLRLLTFQSLPANQFEVIVVSDGSSDGTREMVNSFECDFDLRFYEIPDNGFQVCKCRNIGMKEASYDKLVFTDDDLLPLANYLELFDRTIEPGKAIIGFSDFFQYPNGQFYNMDLYAFGPSSGVMKADLMSIGGYDEDMTFYGMEDFDVGFRLKHGGIPCEYHPEIHTINYGAGYNMVNKDANSSRREEIEKSGRYLIDKYNKMGFNFNDISETMPEPGTPLGEKVWAIMNKAGENE